MSPHGIHHVTAFASDSARTIDFYTRVLGLRLVKKTVNFDDPGTYHLYFGDEAGVPGTILTFFPIAQAAPGRVGIGQVSETAFRVPRAAIGAWTHRFVSLNVAHEAPVSVFGETVLRFRDPDGMPLALVGVEGRRPSRPGTPRASPRRPRSAASTASPCSCVGRRRPQRSSPTCSASRRPPARAARSG